MPEFMLFNGRNKVGFVNILSKITCFLVWRLDRFAISPSIVIIVLVESITVCWLYGLDRFSNNIKEMNGFLPYLNWRLSWKYICPLALAAITLFDAIFFQPLSYGTYVFPDWSNWLGYGINVLALLPIPGYAIYVYFSK